MKVVVLNGSPKGKNSNTMVLTNHFINGLNYLQNVDVTIFDFSKLTINHCLGCFACWRKAPYSCVINDDVPTILKAFLSSDVIIWSFPLYHYGVPSKMKAFIDRTLPISPLFSDVRAGNYYGILSSNTKHVLISTSGDIEGEGFSSVDKMFSLCYDDTNLERIYLKGGEMINYLNDCKSPLDEYLKNIEIAGKEYAQFKKFSNNTRQILSKNIFDTYNSKFEQWLMNN